MRTIINAKYQLDHIMPIAQNEGCKCEYNESDFEDFIDGAWTHEDDCKSKKIECLPNVKMLESLRV